MDAGRLYDVVPAAKSVETMLRDSIAPVETVSF
jgi:hypothetical protein